MKTNIAKRMFGIVLLSVFMGGGYFLVSCKNAASDGSGSSGGGSSSGGGGGGMNIWMSDHEVTQKEWNDVVGDPTTRADPPTATYGNGDNYPMYYVSWYDALVYCNALSMKESRTPCYTINGKTDPADWGPVPTSNDATWNAVTCNFNANGYRLPTEAEWEYMAKGGENYTYSGSNTIGDVAWYDNNSGDGGGTSNRKSHPVRDKSPNKYGMYDMSGNVWEWCWDLYPSGAYRVLRGGSWFNNAAYCAVSFRNSHASYFRNLYVGFRVVRGN